MHFHFRINGDVYECHQKESFLVGLDEFCTGRSNHEVKRSKQTETRYWSSKCKTIESRCHVTYAAERSRESYRKCLQKRSICIASTIVKPRPFLSVIPGESILLQHHLTGCDASGNRISPLCFGFCYTPKDVQTAVWMKNF